MMDIKTAISKILELVRYSGIDNRLEIGENFILQKYDHVLYYEDLLQVLPKDTIKKLKRAGVLKEILPGIYVVRISRALNLIQQLSEYEKTEETLDNLLNNYSFDNLVKLVAPTVEGKEAEKAAILLQLFSDIPEREDILGRMRYRIHVLLLGMPGTAKSVLLDYASKVADNVYLQLRTTGAGLSGSLRRDIFEQNEPALKMADKKLLIIDELDKIPMEELQPLLTAMEEGIVKLKGAEVDIEYKSRIRVLAAANRVRFSPEFLDRFDAIFFEKEYKKDELKRIADKILDTLFLQNEASHVFKSSIEFIKKLIKIRKDYIPRIEDPVPIKEEIFKIIDEEQRPSVRSMQKWLRFAYAYSRIMKKPVTEESIKAVYKIFKGKLFTPLY